MIFSLIPVPKLSGRITNAVQAYMSLQIPGTNLNFIKRHRRKEFGTYKTQVNDETLIQDILGSQSYQGITINVLDAAIKVVTPIDPYVVSTKPTGSVIYVEVKDGYQVKNVKIVEIGTEENGDPITEEQPLSIKEYSEQRTLLT